MREPEETREEESEPVDSLSVSGRTGEGKCL